MRRVSHDNDKQKQTECRAHRSFPSSPSYLMLFLLIAQEKIMNKRKGRDNKWLFILLRIDIRVKEIRAVNCSRRRFWWPKPIQTLMLRELIVSWNTRRVYCDRNRLINFLQPFLSDRRYAQFTSLKITTPKYKTSSCEFWCCWK